MTVVHAGSTAPRHRLVAVAAVVVVVGALPTVAAATSRAPRGAIPASPRVSRRTASTPITYAVSTTTDAALAPSTPPHRCEDAGHTTQCSLRAAVTAAEADFAAGPGSEDVIRMGPGRFTLSATVGAGPLTLSDPGQLMIEGAGAGTTTIDAASLDSGVFAVAAAGGSLSLARLSVRSGYTNGNGGAISTGGETTLTVTGCGFADNGAAQNGGAIWAGATAVVQVLDSSFRDNTADWGGGAIDDASTATLVLTGDTFLANEETYVGAGHDGGAVAAGGLVAAVSDTFRANDADGGGGALDAATGVLTSDSLFTGNRARAGGGAVLAPTALATRVTFSNNAASGDGGAVDASGASTFTDATFTGNDAGVNGGDVFSSGALSVVDTTFARSSADEAGGSVYVGAAPVTLSHDAWAVSRAEGASRGGGALYFAGSSAVLNEVTIARASALGSSGDGGAVACVSCTLAVANSQLSRDLAVHDGGAVALAGGSTASFVAVQMTGDGASSGGGLFVAQGAFATLAQSTLAADTAAAAGGGADDRGGAVTLVDSTLTSDAATGRGGGLAASAAGATVSLTDDTVSANEAARGAGIFATGASVVTAWTTVVGNVLAVGAPPASGGGIDAPSATLVSTGTIWADNEGDQCAGAPATAGGFNLVSDHTCRFSGPGDHGDRQPGLAPLGRHGGPTPTAPPLTGSPAIGAGGVTCPGRDQRGEVVPPGRACDVGSVFVVPTVTALTLSARTVRANSESELIARVTVSDGPPGSAPRGVVALRAGRYGVCTAVLVRTAPRRATGQCHLRADSLRPGVRTIRAVYGGLGTDAGSTSRARTVAVLSTAGP